MTQYTHERSLRKVWGVTIGATVLQNELVKRLPSSFSSEFPQGAEIAYSIVPLISSLSPDLKAQVRVAFADSLQVMWEVLIGIGGLGFLISLTMKHMQLHTKVDENWGLEEQKSNEGDEATV